MRAESLINGGLFRSGLRRFWPLWLIYFIVMMLLLVAPVYTGVLSFIGTVGTKEAATDAMATLWMLMKVQLLFATFFASIIVALSLNEHLFVSRAATFYGSLPVKRDSVFATHYLAGFLSQLGVLAVVAASMLPLCAMHPAFSLSLVGKWLLLAFALTFVFYSLAQLVCQLTGNRVAALLLYVLANTLASCLEIAMRLVVQMLQYGNYSWDLLFNWASPFVGLWDCLLSSAGDVYFAGTVASFLGGTNYMGVVGYCVAAIVFIALAAWLNRRRNMESAGDTVAIPILRPVLKYLAGISMALLFAAFFYLFSWESSFASTRVAGVDAVLLCLVMAIGGFLGLVFVEMSIAKSTRILGSCWKGGLVLAGLSVFLVAACSFDLFGVARYVPPANEVESVEITNNEFPVTTLSSDEAIEDATHIHQEILEYEGSSDSTNDVSSVGFIYHLENGSTVQRSYAIGFDSEHDSTANEEGQNTPGFTLLCEVEDLANSREGLESRYAKVFEPVDNKIDFTIEYGSVVEEYEDGQEGASVMRSIAVPNSQKADFIENALKPDVLEHHAADFSFYYLQADDSYSSSELNASFNAYSPEEQLELFFWLDAEKTPNTVKWLKKHYPDIAL